MNRIGIMQGRLVPPVNGAIQAFPAERWRDEFPLAEAAGLETIEWIYDAPGDSNPLSTDEGLAEIRSLSMRHGIAVPSVCADYFMKHLLIGADASRRAENLNHLRWLIGRCAAIGVTRIVLPFVDASGLQTLADDDALVDILAAVRGDAEAHGVELHLETALNPARFAALLDRIPDPRVRVNYDSGNSSSLGYHPRDEFRAYGHRIGSVHVKDRILGGATVPLGTGSADLTAFFGCLKSYDYTGDVILQVARGDAGDELAWARRNREYVAAGLAR